MSKAILVMDMPDKCGECSLRMGMICSPILKDINSVDKKMDWCPLRELPQKYDKDDSGYDEWQEGDNACIDEIMRGSDENG